MIDATVVIPTYNRGPALVRTLSVLCDANPYPGWEAVVVDDGSTDGTPAVVENWADANRAPVRCVSQPNAGPAAARNRGAAEAQGASLVFLDDDMLVPESFVRSHLQALASNPGSWIVGRVRHPPELRETPFGRYRDDLYEQFHRAHPGDRPSPTTGITATNLSVPAADFRALGGFDEDFTIASGEDWELGMRARQKGIVILYDPSIVAIHLDWAVDLGRFCERQWLYSVSDVLLCRKYGLASPRLALVMANGPIRLGREPLPLSAAKFAKRIMGIPPGRVLVSAASRIAERVLPDSALTRRIYRTAVALAINRGVHEGLRRYGGTALAGPRRVCHLIDASGATPYFRSIARWADGERYPVTIGSVAPAGELQRVMAEADVPTFSLDASARWQYPWAVARMARLVRREGIEIVHAHCFDPTAVGLLAARIAGARFVYTRHHSDHNIRLNKHWHTSIDAFCGRHADHVVVVSEATRRIMIDVEGVPDAQTTLVLNGLESLAQPAPESIDALAADLAIGDVPICLTVARLHEEKGHRVLFDALPVITARTGPVQCLLAGQGGDRQALEEEVRRRGLTTTVRLLGQRADVAELMALATVVVLPSLAESFGFVALEASSLGRPVVVSDAGGLSEVVVDGITGVVVPKGDAEAMADAVCRVLENPEWARALGDAGRHHARSFGADRMVRSYEQVYDRLPHP